MTPAPASTAVATTTTGRRSSVRQTAQRAKRVEAACVAAAIKKTVPLPPRISPPPMASAATIPEALMPAHGSQPTQEYKQEQPMETLHERVAAEVAAREKAAAKAAKDPAKRAIKHTTKKEMLRMLKVKG